MSYGNDMNTKKGRINELQRRKNIINDIGIGAYISHSIKSQKISRCICAYVSLGETVDVFDFENYYVLQMALNKYSKTRNVTVKRFFESMYFWELKPVKMSKIVATQLYNWLSENNTQN